MRPFAYERPATLADAITLLASHGERARVLAGGTDLVIRLRDGTLRPSVVVDIKRVAELQPGIRVAGGRLALAATTTMTEIAADPEVRGRFTALAEAAAVVGSVQIRNRATLGGNLCNASPAADTVPSLLAFGAEVVVCGPGGERRVPLDGFLVRSGVTTLARGELVTGIELPLPARRVGSVHVRRTRRRGHDLASVTLSVAMDEDGVTRLAYGSLGPRPVVAVDESGILADPTTDGATRTAMLETMLASASPSPRSMRAGPAYRLAMLHLLAGRALATAAERLALEGVG